MRKIWLIARREYLFNFRRRSFLFAAFGVPLFSLVMMYVIFTIADTQETQTGQLGTVGYVDYAGVLTEAVEQPEEYQPFADVDSAQAALLDGSIGAYFVLGEDFFSAGQVDAYSTGSVPEGIQRQLESFVKANLALRVPDASMLERVRDPMDITMVEVSSDQELDSAADFGARFMMPFIFGFIYLMAVNTTSQFLMSGVVEEKENRMMEILLTSVRPVEMLWGKVLGLGALGLTQVVLWGAGGLLLLRLNPDNDFVSAINIEPSFLLIALVYFVLGYFFFGAVMAGIGASVSAEQEARSVAGVFTLLAVIPFIALITFIENPNGTVPVILSLFPLTAPISMLMRIPMTAVPAWQVILSLLILLVAGIAVIWLAAQVFRIGLLMYGKRLGLRQILALFKPGQRTMLTTAQEDK